MQTNIFCALAHLKMLPTNYFLQILYLYLYICVCVCVCVNRIWYWITWKGWYATKQPNQRRSLILIIKVFRTIFFIFIVISTTFRPICPPVFSRCLSNSVIYTKLWTMSFIESTAVACSDSVNHNWVQVLRIPVLLFVCSRDWTCNLQMIVSLEA